MTKMTPSDVGWRLGKSLVPRGVELWVPYDRTAGVYGAQGSGKTLDLLAPALIAHPGAAMATLTKLDDLLLTLTRRQEGDRPVVVLDPFGMAPGVPELVWDPIAGCVDPMVAERRAKAFAAGTVTGAVAGGRQDGAARFYANETAKVLQGFFHAAALTGRSLEQVLVWVADPAKAEKPIEILERHPDAAPRWDGLLAGALRGSPETVSNTVTTVQQAMSLFFQPSILARCVPGPGRPATDIADIITRGGTIYLLGREDPYASASPLMTALGEHVLDTALWLATTAEHGRITPSFLACLDELPSTTPFPTLRVRMANERALGLAFIYAAQTWRQMVVAYGEDEARSIFGLTNNIIVFGGGKDIVFYREISDLLGTTRISRDTYTNGPGGMGTSRSSEDTPILRPEQIRLLAQRTALVIAESAPPILVRLRRCIDGKTGRALLAEQKAARRRVIAARSDEVDLTQRTADAVAYAQAHRLHDPRCGDAVTSNSRRPRADGTDNFDPDSRSSRHIDNLVEQHGVVMAVVRAFPAPPNIVQEVLGTLSVLKNGTKTQIEDLGDRRDVPRVWDPAQCDDQVRLDMWTWCESVATWLNHEYGWRPTGQIPACWPEHPHIAHELPVLACLRYAAGKAPDAAPLEEWHRLALPGFLDRMASRIGESGCRKEHDDWPAASRYDGFTSPAAVAARKALLLESDDSNAPPVRQLRPTAAP